MKKKSDIQPNNNFKEQTFSNIKVQDLALFNED